MEEKEFENAAKKIMESEKAVSDAKTAAVAAAEIKNDAADLKHETAAEMKSAADTIVENAAANAEVLEAEAEAATELDEAATKMDAVANGMDEAANGMVKAAETEAAEVSDKPKVNLDDSTQTIDIDYIEAKEADPFATQSEIEMGEQKAEGFDAGNPQYEEHVDSKGAYGSNAGTYDSNAGAYGSVSGAYAASTNDAGSGSYRSGSYGSGSGAYGQTAAQVPHGFITKKAFVIVLIIAMLFTMLASIGITTAYTTYMTGKIKTMSDDHATKYELTKSDESLSYKSIIDKADDSVVSITTESVTNDIWMQNYVTKGAGSGVIIQSNGYIITCEHVIEGARKITVTTKDGKEHDAQIVGADADNDIAVIKIDATGLKSATYGDSSKLEVGDTTVVIGNPLGTLSGTVTTGIISALDRKLTIDNKTLTLLQTDASINPGNSGGGMFDSAGNLIGIVEAKSTGSDIDGLGFATPINKAAKIAKDLIENEGSTDSNNGSQSGKSGDPKIGIMVTEIDSTIAAQYGYAHGGLLVRSVTSPQASLSGLEQGDIIFKADGKNITVQDDLTKILSSKKAGDKLKLTVAHADGSTSELTTVLVSDKDIH